MSIHAAATEHGNTTEDHPLPRRFARWQRASGALLALGGAVLVAKFVLLYLAFPGTLPSVGPIPLESALITSGLALVYSGALGLHLPFARSLPTWLVSLLSPLTLLCFVLALGFVTESIGSLIPTSAHLVLRMETGILVCGATCIAVGRQVMRGATRGR